MIARIMVALAAALLLVGCGGDDEAETSAPAPAETGATSATGALTFEAVEDPSLEALGDEPTVEQECEELGWVEDEAEKKELAPFTGTTTVEVLACDDVPYVAYLEYEDANAADAGLAAALLPYLREETTVVMPLVGLDEEVAADYLEGLAESCGCGEVLEPQ